MSNYLVGEGTQRAIHIAQDRYPMRFSLWLAIIPLVLLIACNSQSIPAPDAKPRTSAKRFVEPARKGLDHPNSGPAQPQPELTPEQREKLLRLKEKTASPWESEAVRPDHGAADSAPEETPAPNPDETKTNVTEGK